MAQQSRYNQFSLVANDWGTKHPVPDPSPRNPAQDTLEFSAAAPEGFQYHTFP
jgi:hypothetical protein